MDVSELVRAVVTSVLEQLAVTASPDCILVLGYRDEKTAAAVEQLADSGCSIRYLGEECASAPVRRLLPYLSCQDMADLATGRAGNAIMAEVLHLLLAGRQVEVLEYEYRAYADTAPGALYRLYARYAEELTEFGLIPFVRPRPEFVRVWDDVISAEHVRQTVEAGASELQILKTALVTPLAIDQARSDSITISKML